MDIVCLSKTYLDSFVPTDDDNLQVPGYSSNEVEWGEGRGSGVRFCLFIDHLAKTEASLKSF